MRAVDTLAASLHNTLSGFEFLRCAAGAGAKTRDLPEDLATWRPQQDAGGFLDRR